MKANKILYATDYTEASEHALDLATTLARDTGAVMLIVHVCEVEQYPVGELFDEEAEPDPKELDKLKSVVARDPRVKCEHRLIYGEPGSVETVKPAVELVKVAEQEKVDMIVIGTHGRTGLGRVFMGSVAEDVVRHASCPVITIRQPTQSASSD